MVLIKLGVLVLFIVIGATGWDSDNLSDFAPFGVDGISVGGRASSSSPTSAWTRSRPPGEEVKNPRRNLPLAIIFALRHRDDASTSLVAIVAVAAQPRRRTSRVRRPGCRRSSRR